MTAPTLNFNVLPGDWGTSPSERVHLTCQSTAFEIWKHCAGIGVLPIDVIRSDYGPRCVDAHSGAGHAQVLIKSRDSDWLQLAYQFGHEFCHVLTTHTDDSASKPRGKHPNMWLEESLCELAALFAMRKLATSWREEPPWEECVGIAPRMWAYVANLIAKPEHSRNGKVFGDWLSDNEPAMRLDSILRDRNFIVAMELLPLFEEKPSGWKSLAFLRLGKRTTGQTLSEHLSAWRSSVPAEMAAFVAEMAARLGVAVLN